jgi:hypothetical protein
MLKVLKGVGNQLSFFLTFPIQIINLVAKLTAMDRNHEDAVFDRLKGDLKKGRRG